MISLFLHSLKHAGWKQQKIAQKAGMSQSFLSQLMNGDTCGIETVIKLADAFGVTTDEVLGRSPGQKAITPTEKLLLETTAGNDEITRAALRSAQGEKLIKEMTGEGRRAKGKAA